MSRDPKVVLYDILTACDEIFDFTQGKTLEDYQNSRLLRAAVERNFTIVGEALNRMKAIQPDLLSYITDWHKVIAFRNIIVHGYDVLDDMAVWQVIESDLTILQNECEFLLDNIV